MMRDKGIIY